MMSKMQTGQEGERLAAEFLKEAGYEILHRNYRYKRSEIDLIVRRDNWLVFVEVKTRNTAYFGYPEEFVDYHKQQTIFEGALNYMYENDWNGNVRYDIISILARQGQPVEIMHFEDAFY